VASAAAFPLMVSGCSSSKPAASTGPSTTATSTSSSSSSTLFVTGAVPTVTGASDLNKQPTVRAGGSNPPTVLTGKDLVVGTGQVAAAHDQVEVQYVGALYTNGQVFDASWTDSGPTQFSLDQVVPGFSDAIIGMKVGGRREIVIPPALGYGASGHPPAIPPNATLVFVIDLLQVAPG
jgi:peptidylprolyl isomerase